MAQVNQKYHKNELQISSDVPFMLSSQRLD
jgi:hypothetical protein